MVAAPLALVGPAQRNLLPTAALCFFPLYPVAWMLALVGDHRWPNDSLAGTAVVRA